MESAKVWIIYFVAFDETPDEIGETFEPFVGKEAIESADDAEMAAFIRGGHLAATIKGTEADAERARVAVEAEVLRR